MDRLLYCVSQECPYAQTCGRNIKGNYGVGKAYYNFEYECNINSGYESFIEESKPPKGKLFLDFDGCIVDTIEAIVSLYNDDFCEYPGFKHINSCDIETWNFTECDRASADYLNTYFNQPRFFKRLQFMPEATNILSGLEEEYDITIVSFGETPNLKLKEKWVKEKLPYAKFIGCNFENYPDKSHVDMSGGIFIDDDAHYLESSNAKIKICFGEEYDWNKEWGGIRMKNWYDVREYLKELEVNKDNKSC